MLCVSVLVCREMLLLGQLIVIDFLIAFRERQLILKGLKRHRLFLPVWYITQGSHSAQAGTTLPSSCGSAADQGCQQGKCRGK